MSRSYPSPGARLLASWQRLENVPFGKRIFSWVVGRTAPYTGTVGAMFVELRPGYAKVTLKDRRKIRNHLSSIHAVALANLAEVTSGVALMTALPPGVRGIVTSLSIDYLKKARGTLTAITTASVPDITMARQQHTVVAEIFDTANELVARCRVQWLLSPSDNKASTP